MIGDMIAKVRKEKGMTKTEFAEYAIELALKLEAEKEQSNAKNKNNKFDENLPLLPTVDVIKNTKSINNHIKR